MKEYGLAIEQFKSKINDGKVFLIVNLNEVITLNSFVLQYSESFLITDCAEWSSSPAHNLRYLQPSGGGCSHLPLPSNIQHNRREQLRQSSHGYSVRSVGPGVGGPRAGSFNYSSY